MGLLLRIDLNVASQSELSLLPGIGPSLAGRIAEDRKLRGPYDKVEDLRRVVGIGPRIVER
ncbi:MAG: helix-hairpin-helix domain-containing protein, partial [Planctomycetota bacterium]|nr:helix-hairpin-helix domain-containing protein [Planctomycetota bacterium]